MDTYSIRIEALRLAIQNFGSSLPAIHVIEAARKFEAYINEVRQPVVAPRSPTDASGLDRVRTVVSGDVPNEASAKLPKGTTGGPSILDAPAGPWEPTATDILGDDMRKAAIGIFSSLIEDAASGAMLRDAIASKEPAEGSTDDQDQTDIIAHAGTWSSGVRITGHGDQETDEKTDVDENYGDLVEITFETLDGTPIRPTSFDWGTVPMIQRKRHQGGVKLTQIEPWIGPRINPNSVG